MHVRTVTIAAVALVLAAGAATPVHASTNALAASRSNGLTTLTLNGAAIRATRASIVNPRLITLSRSNKVIALWDEVSGTGTVQHYYGLSLDGRGFDQVLPTTYTIRLAYAAFDPKTGEPPIPPVLQAADTSRAYLVQFVIPPIDEFRRDIGALGGTVNTFLTDHTHIVTMDAAAAAKVAALPYVRWVGKYHPAYRLSSEVRDEVLGRTPEIGPKRYSIECMQRGIVQQRAVADAAKRSGGILEVVTPDQFRMEATLSRAQVLALAQMDEVNYIDPWGGPGGVDMNVVRQLQGAIPTLSDLNYTGQGVRGEVMDTEVRTTHQAFQTPPVLLHGGSAGNPAVEGYHGSSCYGIIFANWSTNTFYNGMDTSAEQGIYNFFRLNTQFGGASSRLSLNTEAVDPAGPYRSCFQSSSVGSDPTTSYTTVSAETDDYLFLVDYLSCQSQSNQASQMSRPQAWAKNIISVGGIAWNSTLGRADDAYSSASYGPAADLRWKPDLANCYDNIPATSGTSDTATVLFGGTSGATPITAGGFGLLMQLWHSGVFPGFGGGSSVFADRPRSTTAKAMMINAAYRYPLTQGGLTRAKQGWGMPDLTNLYTLRNQMFIVNETDVLQNAQSKIYPFTVTSGAPSIGFTMVYVDPKGNPAAVQARVNDLSLRITDPNGNMYWGNNGLGTSNWSSPGGAADTVNTVENVFIQNPTPGPWMAEVIGTSIVQDARPQTPGVTDAAYAFVASGLGAGPTPALFFQFPSDPPSLVPPGTPSDIVVRILPGSQSLVAGSPTFFYRLSPSDPFTSQALTSLGNNLFRGTLPGPLCGSTPQYYFAAQGSGGGAPIDFPFTAPAGFFTTSVGTISNQTVLQASFNGSMPAGWTASGLWHISGSCAPSGTPCAGSQAAYFGQDATCNYDTGSSTGITGTLTAPSILLPTSPTGGLVTLTFCTALITEGNSNFDTAEVLVNGSRVSIVPDSAAWGTQTVDLTAYAGQTVSIAFRFTAVDGVLNNFRGWHIGSVTVTATASGCTDPCYANCDASTAAPILNVNDFQCFINKYAAGDSYANCDGSTTAPVLNVNDFQCFLNKFAAGCS